MKKISVLFSLILLSACTSNTIFKEPKDLIPKDSMIVLIEELLIANSSKTIENKFGNRNINYLPFVKEKYKIDSARFAQSNLYYVSNIDLYLEILTEVKENIAFKRDSFQEIKITQDSLKIDSLKRFQNKKLDSLLVLKDSLQIDSLKQVFKEEIFLLEDKIIEQENI